MKKRVVSIFILSVVAALCFSLSACGGDLGTYAFEDIEISNAENVQEVLSVIKPLFENQQYRFKGNGKLLVSEDSGKTWDNRGTYSIDGNEVKFFDRDGKPIFKNEYERAGFEGERFIMYSEYEGSGVKITFKKQ